MLAAGKLPVLHYCGYNVPPELQYSDSKRFALQLKTVLHVYNQYSTFQTTNANASDVEIATLTRHCLNILLLILMF